MKRLFVLVVALALGSIAGSAQLSPESDCSLPKEAVERVWKLATQGDPLTPEGWDKMARGAFAYPAPTLGNKVTPIAPRGDKVILVASNEWGVVGCQVKDKKARVAVEYYDAGSIDAMLRYTPGKEPPPIGKSEMLFTLVFAPGHWETYKSNGKSLEIAEVKTSPDAWRIESPQGPPWTTVNTAIRYVLEARERTQDPTVKKNAEITLAELLRFHKN